MAVNRYNLNNKLVRLKMELEEAQLELAHSIDSGRRANAQNRINNIKSEIKEIEDEIDRIYKELDS